MKYIWHGWFQEGFARFDEINSMDIPLPQKVQLHLEKKMEFLSRMGPQFIGEFLHGDPELREFVEQFRVRSRQAFLQFMIDAQKKGDMRPEVRPEFVVALLDKLTELADDERLLSIYSDPIELIREINYFLFYGILPRPDSEGW